MDSAGFKRIGLTGGIASGKTTVAGLFRKAGLTVVDLDAIGRNLTEGSSTLAAEIDRLCGGGVLTPQGLDRKRLREILFANAETRRAVEAFLHPLILDQFENEVQKAKARGEKLIICEAALLIETGFHKELDELVLVTADEAVRRQRVIDRDKIDETLVTQIMAAQVSDDKRRPHATAIIENHGDTVELAGQVQKLIDGWKAN